LSLSIRIESATVKNLFKNLIRIKLHGFYGKITLELKERESYKARLAEVVPS
jgi:hypothetical protein